MTVIIQKVYSAFGSYFVIGTVNGTSKLATISASAVPTGVSTTTLQTFAASLLVAQGAACTEITAVEGTFTI